MKGPRGRMGLRAWARVHISRMMPLFFLLDMTARQKNQGMHEQEPNYRSEQQGRRLQHAISPTLTCGTTSTSGTHELAKCLLLSKHLLGKTW